MTFKDESENSRYRWWYFGDGTKESDVEVTHQYSDTGVYQVILEASNICHKSTDTLYISIVGIEDYAINNLNIYVIKNVT